MNNLLNIFLCLLFLTGCQTSFSQKYIGDENDIQAILSQALKLSSSIVNSDYDAIARIYTADAKIFPGNRPIIEGREDIRDYWVLPDSVSTTFHKLHPQEIKIYGSDAYDYGIYEGKTKRADGTESSWKGKYVVIWRKENGKWKMYLDIWNRSPAE